MINLIDLSMIIGLAFVGYAIAGLFGAGTVMILWSLFAVVALR